MFDGSLKMTMYIVFLHGYMLHLFKVLSLVYIQEISEVDSFS